MFIGGGPLSAMKVLEVLAGTIAPTTKYKLRETIPEI
jgi:hypothetical protein